MQRYPILILAVLVCLSAPVLAGLDKDSLKTTVADFDAAYRAVRPEFLEYPVYSLKVDNLDHPCHVPQTLRRLALAGETFRIRKVDTKRDHFRVELETPGKTRLTIRAYDRGKLSQGFLDAGLKRLLNDIFEFGAPPPPVQFVGHTESSLLHLDRCNHLPALELRQVFAEYIEAIDAGFRECPICFEDSESLPYPGYLGHRTEGLQNARVFELVYPVSPDPELQARLDRLGAVVLAHWPLELSGFDYEFRVVQADQPLASSFRTGIVVVSDTMLEAADSDEEILFVLAHEIAHCELHLPPRSPYAGRESWSSLSGEYYAYGVWIGSQQLAADLMAVAWFQGLPDGNWDFSRARAALAKVQHAIGDTDQLILETGQYSDMHRRLWLFEPSRFQPGDPRRVFAAFDGEGDIRYEVRFLGLLKDQDEKDTIPYFLLTTTDYQEKVVNWASPRLDGFFKDANGKKTTYSIKPFTGAPGFSTIIIGKTRFGDSFDSFTPGPLIEAGIDGLDGVKRWRVLTTDEGS